MYEQINQQIDEQATSKYFAELFKNIPIEQFAKKHNFSEKTYLFLINSIIFKYGTTRILANKKTIIGNASHTKNE